MWVSFRIANFIGLGFMIWGLGFGVYSLGFRVYTTPSVFSVKSYDRLKFFHANFCQLQIYHSFL